VKLDSYVVQGCWFYNGYVCNFVDVLFCLFVCLFCLFVVGKKNTWGENAEDKSAVQ
jgi:hypothetical protein